jgi:hypothetical protein
MFKVEWLRRGWVPQTRLYRTKEAASAAYATACLAESVIAARLSVSAGDGWATVSRCFRSQSASAKAA